MRRPGEEGDTPPSSPRPLAPLAPAVVVDAQPLTASDVRRLSARHAARPASTGRAEGRAVSSSSGTAAGEQDAYANRRSADLQESRRSRPRRSVDSHASSSVTPSRGGGGGGRASRTDSEMARALASEVDDEGSSDEELQQGDRGRSNTDDSSKPGVRVVLTPQAERGDAELAAAILAEEMAAMQEHQEREERLLADPRDYARPQSHTPWFCRSVLATCSLIMALELIINGGAEPLSVNPLIGPSVATLTAMGAKSVPLILKGEFYRLVTPIYLHAGVGHLLFNMLGLWNMGFPAEREFGSNKIAAIYICSGISGVLMSCVFLPSQVGVGASGAIFGLFGSAWADLLHNWSLYRGQAWCVFFQLLFGTVFNLTLGLVPFIDNFAHLGGFLTGILMGFSMLVQKRYNAMGIEKMKTNKQLLLQAFAITIIPVAYASLLLCVYLQIDVATSCQWCQYISCVPMPPGAAVQDRWWDCGPCSLVNLELTNITQDGAYTISCPSDKLHWVSAAQAQRSTLTVQAISQNNKLALESCKVFCLGESYTPQVGRRVLLGLAEAEMMLRSPRLH